MGTIEVTSDIVWHVAQDLDTLLFIASCKVFGLSTRAVTFNQLYDNAFETTENLLRALHAEGEFASFLADRGLRWEQRGRPTPAVTTRFEIRLFAEWSERQLAMAS
ncbi:MAG: hypothetical protein ACJAZO_003091 [Myxococcota bacterium]|jgi:hypothetical protein